MGSGLAKLAITATNAKTKAEERERMREAVEFDLRTSD
jgi:hypothetical protein